MKIFNDVTGKGTYATHERAVKRAEKACADFGVDFRYLIASSVDGRFFPVVVLRRDEQNLCGALAHYGVCVTF